MHLMEQMMRWFGPNDPVSLQDIRQAGCTGVVTALHHIPVGDVWPVNEIEKRKSIIESAGLSWTVIESLPVSEEIKKQKGNYLQHIENYKISLQNVAACGLKVVTYNFMPVLDWMRTNPIHKRIDGSQTLRFEKAAFMAFDLFLLKRPGAEKEYSVTELATAKSTFEKMSEAEKNTLFKNTLLGLPGSDDAFTTEGILKALDEYKDINTQKLKEHLFFFLQQVVPVAQEVGLKMAIHPDDPPYPILGLPRIVSTQQDIQEILDCIPSQANGLCFCTGSLGVRPDNNLIAILQSFAENIHFLHFRNTIRDVEGNFEEAEHLNGDTDMVTMVNEVLQIMQKRGRSIPMRPDHGFQMMDDLNKKTYPGYTLIGRMKGLAELRGVELGLARNLK